MEKNSSPSNRVPGFPSAGRAGSTSRAAPAGRAAGPEKAPGTVEAASLGRGREPGHHGRFATAINCMDGRVQLPVINWMRENLSVDYVDMITEPGPDRLLAEGGAGVDSVKARVLISVNKHGSDTILMVSHDDCAGNPVSPAEHAEHLGRSINLIRSWKLPVKRVLGAWIGQDWKVQITEASA